MAVERWDFFNWLEAHTGTPVNILNYTAGPSGPGIAPPGFGDNYERNPQFQTACARVRYRVAFVDSDRSVVYLEHCEVRWELRSTELDELAKLREASKSQPTTFSKNYRQVFWAENGLNIEAKLTPNQAAAISALYHSPGHVLAREEWREQIHGDSPPADFRPDKLFAYADGPKVWKRFIRVEGDRYRLVIEPE
jgi:hypothetical protein